MEITCRLYRPRKLARAELGLANHTFVGLFGMHQAFWLPTTMRLAHGAEVAADSFAWAALLVLLLVRPVSATDPGCAPTAHTAAA